MPQTKTENNLLADFCSIRAVVLVAVIMVLLAIVMLLVPGQRVKGGWEDLGMLAMFLQWLGMLSLMVLCLCSPWLKRMSLLLSAMTTFVLIQLVTLGVSEVVYQMTAQMDILKHLTPPKHDLFLLRNAAISIIISGVALRYMYVQRQLQIQSRAEDEARIQALQARIRPHFLFNSMNTIAALTHIDAVAAEKAIIDLSEIFRETLNSDGTMSSLKDEVNLAKHYLEVEKLRLHDRLQINWEVDDQLLALEMPGLVLQPLVENAVYHGIEPLPDGGEITIKVSSQPAQAIIEIINPLPQNNLVSAHEGNQMALQNIKDRLAIAYGQKATIESFQSEDHYRLKLVLPFKQYSERS